MQGRKGVVMVAGTGTVNGKRPKGRPGVAKKEQSLGRVTRVKTRPGTA
jgi:hypothetical protein